MKRAGEAGKALRARNDLLLIMCLSSRIRAAQAAHQSKTINSTMVKL